MTRHDFDSKRVGGNFFHSSYNGGNRVTMAGTIGIMKGQIIGIRSDSGHYKPGLHNMNAFLWALRMYQVDLRRIALFDHAGDRVGGASYTAENFLRDGKKLEAFLKGARQEQQKLDHAKTAREATW